MSRATRLAELQDQIAKDTGYGGIADMAGADRQRAEQAALLKLQYECCAAKLVSGGELVTTELLALNAALNDTLPAAKAKPLVISFVDEFSCQIKRAINACAPGDDVGRTALALANDRIVELEAQSKSLTEQVASAQREIERLRRGPEPAAENSHSRPPLSHHEVLPPLRAVPASRDASPWAAFADLNAGFGSQCPAAAHGSEYRFQPDAVDAFGRRVKQT